MLAINLFITDSKAEEIKIYNNNLSGNVSIKTWLSNDTFTQVVKKKSDNTSQKGVQKTSAQYLEINSNYWFGLVSQNNLYNLGPLFGIGLDFLYSSASFDNVDFPNSAQNNAAPFSGNATSYFMDFSFARLALLHDEKMSKYISLSGHYTNYSNYVLGSTSLSGLAIGIESQYNLFDLTDLYLKANYIPSTQAGLLKNSFGFNLDTGFKWYISPKASIDISYKGFYYAGSADLQLKGTDAQGKATPVDVNISIEDFNHGVVFGGTYYF